MLNELREMEKQGAREREAIRRQCDADIVAIRRQIVAIRRQKEEMINEIDRKHAETMAAIEADHEAKMQTLNDKSKEIRAAIEEAKRNNDFSKVCELLKQMAESIA